MRIDEQAPTSTSAEDRYKAAVEDFQEVYDRFAPHSPEIRDACQALDEARQAYAEEQLADSHEAGDDEDDDQGRWFDALQEVLAILREEEVRDLALLQDVDEAQEIVDLWEPRVADPAGWTTQRLEVEAIDNRNFVRNFHRDNGIADASASNDIALTRWVVNFVRHSLTDYDETLKSIEGLPGNEECSRQIRHKADRAVATFLAAVRENDANASSELAEQK